MKHIGVIVVVLIGVILSCEGHSYVTSPTTRSNQKQSNTGCRGPACLGPCDVKLAQARTPQTTVQRGASITVEWPRNNHAGGFIRFAWAPTVSSDSHAPFDAGVQMIVCHEIGGCKPDNPNDPNGGDSGAGDGSFQPCKTTITVPGHLTDGAWTLQWAWFGGAFALGDYYSCVDYIVSGGALTAQITPYFKGGDYSFPGQNKCKFFNTDRLHQCVNEPCNAPIYPSSQQQSGPAYGVALYDPNGGGSTSTSSSSGVPPQPQSVTTKSATTKSATTAARPITSGVQQPPQTLTTGAGRTQTGALTTASSPQPNGNDGNCAGVSTLSSSTATITSVDAWSNVFRIVVAIQVSESVLSGWRLEILWPSNAVNTQIQSVYNGGVLACQSNSPMRHSIIKPVASWADNLTAGSTQYVEIVATNTNMDTGFIQSNTVVKVFKQ